MEKEQDKYKKNGYPDNQDDQDIQDDQDNTGKQPGQDRENGTPAQEQCCTHKVKEREPREFRNLIHRLNRIEGQVRGIKGMVEKDAYCTDILVQVAAVNAALNSFNKVLLANHIRTCVAKDIREGKEETIDELVLTLQKLMK